MNNVKFKIGRIYISATNLHDAESSIIKQTVDSYGGFVCVTNLRMVQYAHKHMDYAELMKQSFMNLPDGMPLVWCGHLWGIKTIQRTSGPDLFKTILENGDKRLKHYLLGDTQDVLNCIKERYFNANIVGMEALPFIDVEEFDYKQISNNIKKSGANIIWTAMTAPKQDYFNQRLYSCLPNVLCIGVGRAFRLSIDNIKMAPKWAMKCGIGGFFMRRRKWYKTGCWYLKSSFVLAYYMLCIFWQRYMYGKNGKI